MDMIEKDWPPVTNRSETQELERTETGSLVPRWATLDGFTQQVSAMEGLSLNELEPLTTLLIETQNSLYRITVSERTSVLVHGGQFFPITTQARLDGSGFGGSMIKLAWIGVGLCMEICSDSQRIITSPVRTIAIQRDPPVAALH